MLPFFKLTEVPGWKRIGWICEADDGDVILLVTSVAPVSNRIPPLSVALNPCSGANVLAALTLLMSPAREEYTDVAK